MSKRFILLGALVAAGCATLPDQPATSIDVHAISDQGVGAKIGTVVAVDTPAGVSLVTRLSGLTPGTHGFHLHQNGSCAPALQDGKMVPGLAAGGHYDPAGTKAHSGPHGTGHLGDLPALQVAADGTANLTLLAPRLKLSDFRGRALIIHAGGDNYSDQPAALGGGGARIACGLVPG